MTIVNSGLKGLSTSISHYHVVDHVCHVYVTRGSEPVPEDPNLTAWLNGRHGNRVGERRFSDVGAEAAFCF